MNSQVSDSLPNRLSTPDERHIRNAYAAIIILIISIIPTIALFGYFGFTNNQWQLLAIAGILLVVLIIDFTLPFLIQRGRSNLAMMILMTNFIIVVLTTTLLVQGLGLVIAVATILVVISISSLTMPPRYVLSSVIVATLAGLGLFLLDINYPENRLTFPQIEFYAPYITAILGLGFIVLGIRQFNRFSLQIKIVLGIMVTGGITIAVLLVFSLNRANLIVNILAKNYETSVTDKTEAQIINIVQSEADKADDLFSETEQDLLSIAEYRAKLESQRDVFSTGTYWNSSEKMFQLPGGQYSNSSTDPSSIFIPNTYVPNQAMFTDLNTTAYLDFYVPSFLEAHPEVVAIYYISTLGATTYYPNIDLAKLVPADFNTLQQPFYTIATPQNNPERAPRWTDPYQDPAGTGLIVTLSIPVYTSSSTFKGVIGADLQLSKITESISNIRIGQTGFAFLVDKSGHIIAMPARGYTLFELQPEEIPINESPKQTVLGSSSKTLQVITQHIMNGETDLITAKINNIDTYVGFAPLNTLDYRFSIFAPTNELNADIVTSRQETQNEILNSAQSLVAILVALFIGALLISLGIGQIITRPLLNLTKTVEQITGGDLSARASINSQDETGLLATSFNLMAERLNNTLLNMEQRVLERTHALKNANEGNARRAAQFESISSVARAISSTQTMNALLPQITNTISEQFKFYHVGIFLLDTHREYAILVAANSAGGKMMLDRNHRLLVGGSGIVGFVTNTGQPRLALDVGQDAAFFNNPDLPDTHSEIALPLRIGTEIIGALDVQSMERNAFSQEDVSILSTLADQVSIAIQNARSYQQSREALAQAEAASIQLSGQQWKQFFITQPHEGYVFDGIDSKSLSTSDKERTHSLAIPLTLRGTRIGTLKLSASDPTRTWTEDEIAMAQATAERTALAVESARLLQEAQKRASKERTIGDISAKIGGLVNIESILQTAIQELGNNMPNTDIAIQFKKDQETE